MSQAIKAIRARKDLARLADLRRQLEQHAVFESLANLVDLRRFMGAHVFAPSLALAAPDSFSDIVRELYEPRLRAGARIDALTTSAPWHDVGSPGRYLDAVLDWAAGEDRARDRDLAVIEEGAMIEGGAIVRRSLVLGGARVASGCQLDRAVIGPQVEIEQDTVLQQVMVTPRSLRWRATTTRLTSSPIRAPRRGSGASCATCSPWARGRSRT